VVQLVGVIEILRGDAADAFDKNIARVMRSPKARAERMASFERASKPSTSALGLASA